MGLHTTDEVIVHFLMAGAPRTADPSSRVPSLAAQLANLFTFCIYNRLCVCVCACCCRFCPCGQLPQRNEALGRYMYHKPKKKNPSSRIDYWFSVRATGEMHIAAYFGVRTAHRNQPVDNFLPLARLTAMHPVVGRGFSCMSG